MPYIARNMGAHKVVEEYTRVHMDAELKSLLEENLRVSKETNELLRSMNRQAWWGFAGRVVLWILVIILPLLLLPMIIGQFLEAYTGSSEFNMEELQKLLEQYQTP